MLPPRWMKPTIKTWTTWKYKAVIYFYTMKILVIRFSSIGDIVLCTPVLRCIKKQIENVELHFATGKQFEMAIATNPYIDKFFYLENQLDDLIASLKMEEYEYIIDLHNNVNSNAIKKALQNKSSTINHLNFRKFLLTKLKIDLMPDSHFTTRSILAAKIAGIKDDGNGLDFFIPEEMKIKENDLPHGHIAGFIAIVIAAHHFTKNLPVNKVQELCSKIDFPLVLVGGPDEKSKGDEIAGIDNIKIYNACGKFNLYESADIIRKARLVICQDTGLLFIACAFQKPLLAIWGGTSPRLEAGPYYGDRFLQQHPDIYENIFLDLWCQPCSKHGKSYCPRGHFNCMKKQDTDYISRRAMEMVKAFPVSI